MNSLSKIARNIDCTSADMSDLGTCGVDLAASSNQPNLIQHAPIYSTFKNACTNDVPRSFRHHSSVAVAKICLNDLTRILNVLRDANPLEELAKFALVNSAQRIFVDDVALLDATISITYNATVQRIFVCAKTNTNFINRIKPFCYYRPAQRFVQFQLNDPRDKFVAQSLFGIDHNVSVGLQADTISFARDFKDGLLASSGLWQQCVGTICKLTIVCRTDDSIIIGAVMVDLFLNWGVDLVVANGCWTMMSDFVKTIISYSRTFVGQSADAFIPQTVVKAVCAIATCIFAVIGSMALPSQKLIDGVLSRINNLGRATTGFSTLFEVASGLFERIYGYVYTFIYGVPLPGTELDQFLAGVREWYESVSDISNLETADEIVVDFKLCRKIEKLYTEGKDYVKRLESFKLTAAQKAPFDQYFRIVCKIYDRVVAQGARSYNPRTEPLIIHLFGASSVGKSGLTYLLAQNLLALEGLESEFMDEIYFRNVEQEFWDGYHGQAICVYDDFGQKRDSTGNPNQEFMEIIRSGNIAPWPLHMADLENKARTRFTSRCCILTSNQKRFEMASLTHDVAFMRRLDMYAEVSIAPGYCLANGRIDPSKVGEVLDTNIYRFTLFGEDSKPLQRSTKTYQTENIVLDYDQFVAWASEEYKKKFFTSHAKVQFLKDRAVKLVQPKAVSTLPTELATLIQVAKTKSSTPIDEDVFVAQAGETSWFCMFKTGHVVEEGHSLRVWEIICKCVWMDVRSGFKKDFVYGDSYTHMIPALRDLACTRETSAEFLRDAYTHIAIEGAHLLDLEIVVETSHFNKMNDLFHGRMSLSKRVTNVVKSFAEYSCDKFLQSIRTLSTSVVPAAAAVMTTVFNIMKCVTTYYIAFKICGVVRAYLPFETRNLGNIFEEEAAPAITESIQLDKIKAKPTPKHYLESVQVDKIKNSTQKFYKESVNIDRKPRVSHKAFRNETASELDTRSGRRKLVSEAAIDSNSQEILNTTVKSNAYLLYTQTDGIWKPKVNLVFIKGRVAITVAHSIPYLGDTLRVANAWIREGYTVRTEDCIFKTFVSSKGENKDLVSITFPNSVPAHANLLKHFSTLADYPLFRQTRGNLFSLHSNVRKGSENILERLYTVVNLHAIESKDYVVTEMGTERAVMLRHGYMYEAETQGGDCGGLIMASNPSLPRKLLGVHVAGATSGKALSISVTQEMLNKHFLTLDDFKSQVCYNVEDLPIQVDKLPNLPEGDFIPLGKSLDSVGSSSKTQLRPSKLYDLVKEPTTKPAFLRPLKINGELVDPMMKGLKKCGTQNPLLDNAILARCTNHVIQKLRKYTYGDKKVFSHAEAIRGVEGDEWLVPMNRRSSPGFPWCMHRDGKMGKTKWLGSDEDYILDNPELLEICTRRIEMAKEGLRLPPLWTDTLKDERRPIEKVNAGKTRVFSAGSMDFVLNVRQYFLSFNAAMMENRIENEIALGINPFSEDWHYLALHLNQKGDQVCAGDFSNFDGSLLSSMLWAVCDIINAWYGDCEENQRVRYVLFADIINSIHINGNNVYGWTHSQPSGNPLTTTINCLMNCLIFRYVFITATGLTMREWDKHISFVSYGDDNVINIDKCIIDKFNQEIISEHCSKIGFTYTDEAKTGILVKYKPLSEINFLKRRFLRDADSGLFEAPLELDVILEMCMWVRGTTDGDTRCSDIVEIAYKELSLHGRATFEEWAPVINDLCLEHLNSPPTLYTYHEYKAMVMDYF